MHVIEKKIKIHLKLCICYYTYEQKKMTMFDTNGN
jgi:hypothetical protein